MPAYDPLPSSEQNGDSGSNSEENDREVEQYYNKEKVNRIIRSGRIKDAFNRCGVGAIYAASTLVALIIVSFLGGLVIAPYLPEERVNTELIFGILNWIVGAFKEVFLAIGAFLLGRRFDVVSNVVQAVIPNE
ncbi:MAG: hypothetical protein OXO48_13605 [Caldilineaceae bacterium]|nr:hypothetical protein [Caldilineaceae bacterium]